MKTIFIFVLGFTMAQGVALTGFAREKASNSNSTRPVTKKRVLVAFKTKDTQLTSLKGMTPEEIQANPLIAAQLRQKGRVASVLSEPIPEDVNTSTF